MNAFDALLVKSVRKTVKENLGKPTTRLIEEIIASNKINSEKNEFELIYDALRQIFGNGGDGVILTALKSICQVSSKTDKEGTWFTINDKEFLEKIVMALQDDYLKKIIDVTNPVPLTAEEIVSLLIDIPSQEVLKKINYLLSDNILTVTRDKDTNQRRYKSIVVKVEINETIGDNYKSNTTVPKMSLLVDGDLQDSVLLKIINTNR